MAGGVQVIRPVCSRRTLVYFTMAKSPSALQKEQGHWKQYGQHNQQSHKRISLAVGQMMPQCLLLEKLTLRNCTHWNRCHGKTVPPGWCHKAELLPPSLPEQLAPLTCCKEPGLAARYHLRGCGFFLRHRSHLDSIWGWRLSIAKERRFQPLRASPSTGVSLSISQKQLLPCFGTCR